MDQKDHSIDLIALVSLMVLVLFSVGRFINVIKVLSG